MKKFLITEEEKKHILSLYYITEDFKSQKKKFIEQGYDEYIVDKYLNDFREIKDKKYKEAATVDIPTLNVPKGNDRFNIDNYKTFKELESLVDYMSGQRNIGDANFKDIKVDGKPIFENDEVIIYYAPNKESCVSYKGNKPYSWCVSRDDASNMYYRYRMGENEPSFYFVKRKKSMEKEFEYWNENTFQGSFLDKWHFLVIQVLKQKPNQYTEERYIITSANNDGDTKTNWDGVIKVAPELIGLQDYFKNVELTEEEKINYNKFKSGLSDEEFSKLSYKDKNFYIDVGVDSSKLLSDKKFSNLPDDLKNKYINLGLSLTDNQLEMIQGNSKLIKRYREVTEKLVDSVIENKHAGWNDPSFGIISKNQYELVSDEKKKMLDKILIKDLNQYMGPQMNYSFFMKEISEILSAKKDTDDFYFDFYRKRFPDIFYLKKFSSKDALLKDRERFISFASGILFFKSMSVFEELLYFVDLTLNDFMGLLNEKESELFSKILSYKKQFSY